MTLSRASQARLDRALTQARLALYWEAIAPTLWPPLIGIVAFASLAALGLWDRLGDPARALGLCAGLGAGAFWFWRKHEAFALPSKAAAARRVETDSRLSGRPLETLADRPALTDPKGEALWAAHQKRMAEAAQSSARARRPLAALARSDAWALRIAAIVGLAVAITAGGPNALDRIMRAFAPTPLAAPNSTVVVDAWIDPPQYTRLAPIFLTAASAGVDGPAAAPQGSEFVVRVAGLARAPLLVARTEDATQRLRLEAAGEGVFEARLEVTASTELRLTGPAGRTWRIDAAVDQPPIVGITDGPERTLRDELGFNYAFRDDYGLERLVLRVRRPDQPEDVAEFDIDPPGLGLKTGDGRAAVDATDHPWAGLTVIAQLAAIDGAGQEGLSPPVEAVLPEVLFLNPFAKAVAEQRATLLRETGDYAPSPPRPPLTADEIPPPARFTLDDRAARIGRAPEGVQRAADMLRALAIAPERFITDNAVWLGLDQARRRLERARDMAIVPGVAADLWDLARRIELGDLADAEAALRAAEEALRRALARGASAAELARLAENFRRAAQRYIQALTEEAIREGRLADANGQGQQRDQASIEEALQALRDLAETGARGDARQMLDALSQLLDNLQVNLAQRGQGGQGPPPTDDPQDRELQEALERLSEMIGEQRELQDRTFRQGEADARAPDGPTPPGGALAQGGGQSGSGDSQAEQLRRLLESLREDQRRAGAQPGQQPGGEGPQGQSPGGVAPGDRQAQGQAQGQGQGAGDGRQGERGFGAGAQGDQQRQAGPGYGALADDQQALAEALRARGEAAQDRPAAGEEGQALADADAAMREAERALRDGRSQDARRAQDDAVEALRRGAEALAQELFARQTDQAGGGRPRADRETDPFGRSVADGQIFDGLTGGVVPDEAERLRAREILDELRRRLSEAGRDARELDYLERLLDQF
ncbi:MAG: DUF4175 domain-containing protein [Maricaulaceae bacterium]